MSTCFEPGCFRFQVPSSKTVVLRVVTDLVNYIAFSTSTNAYVHNVCIFMYFTLQKIKIKIYIYISTTLNKSCPSTLTGPLNKVRLGTWYIRYGQWRCLSDTTLFGRSQLAPFGTRVASRPPNKSAMIEGLCSQSRLPAELESWYQ